MDSYDHHSKTEVPPEKWAYHPQRLPPVQQFWINRLIQARGDGRKQASVVEMMSFAGYSESVIRAATEWAAQGELIEPGVLHVRNYLDATTCRRLIEDGDASKPIPVGVIKKTSDGLLKSQLSDARVVAQLPWRQCLPEALKILREICVNQISPHYLSLIHI